MNPQPRTRLNLVATAVLGLVIVVLVNYIASRHYKRWDWTTHGLFTLYDERLPASVVSARHFDSWWKKRRRSDPDLLTFSAEQLTRVDVAS